MAIFIREGIDWIEEEMKNSRETATTQLQLYLVLRRIPETIQIKLLARRRSGSRITTKFKFQPVLLFFLGVNNKNIQRTCLCLVHVYLRRTRLAEFNEEKKNLEFTMQLSAGKKYEFTATIQIDFMVEDN